jgi:hypothetical protein
VQDCAGEDDITDYIGLAPDMGAFEYEVGYFLGCPDPEACNYDETANVDDGSCEYYDECGCCGGAGMPDMYCGCESECGVDDWQEADECGTCDSDSANDCVQDCAGTWGGNAYDQGCGCGVYVELPTDGCDNVCGSTLEFDVCGVCAGSGIPDGACDCAGNVVDCAGVCGGYAVEDDNGICIEQAENCIDLHEGANLISFSIVPQFSDFPECIEAILGEGEAAVYGDNGWIGSMTELSCDDGYWLQNTCDDFKWSPEGMECSNSLSYSLHAGPNLISYPFSACGDIRFGPACNE